MLKFPKGNEKGFTLIELLIVVAIIGILAAIAIPQFSSYRQRAFNSAAQSDIKNARVAAESLFADWQLYGSSVPNVVITAAAGVAAGAIIDGGAAITAGSANVLATTTAGQAVNISVSNNVQFRAITDATFSSLILVSEHRQGDRAFSMDSDSTILYYSANPAWIGGAAGAINATVVASTTGTDDIAATPAAGGVAPAANWTPL